MKWEDRQTAVLKRGTLQYITKNNMKNTSRIENIECAIKRTGKRNDINSHQKQWIIKILSYTKILAEFEEFYA